MDKPTIDRFRMLAEHYKTVADDLDISLSDMLLLILSEQINDIFVKGDDDEMTIEQKRELQTISAKDLFHSLTTDEREQVLSLMRELLAKRDEE